MRFLLLVHSPRSRWDELPADGTDDEMRGHVALIEELHSSGRLVDCSPLAPPERSVTVRVRNGSTTVVENTSVDTEDSLAGYYVIECAGMEEAVGYAARVPDAATSKVLLQPLLHLRAVARTGS